MKIKTSDIQFSVTQGVVCVNSIDVLQLTPHVLLFHIDFKNKYPKYSGTDGGTIFWFGADKDTLDVTNHKANLMNVEVIGLDKVWRIRQGQSTHKTVEMGRYYANVYIVKAGRKKQVWRERQ